MKTFLELDPLLEVFEFAGFSTFDASLLSPSESAAPEPKLSGSGASDDVKFGEI